MRTRRYSASPDTSRSTCAIVRLRSERLNLDLAPTHQRANAANHLVGAQIIVADVGDDFAQQVERRILATQQRLGGFRVAQDRAQRLIDFVGHHGRELAHRREPRGVRQLAMSLLRRACDP